MAEHKDFLSEIYHPTGDIVCREVAGEKILVPVRGNLADMQRLFSLNPVAAHIWDRLDGEKSMSAVLSSILEEFAVTAGEAESDLRDFIKLAFDAGLVERNP